MSIKDIIYTALNKNIYGKWLIMFYAYKKKHQSMKITRRKPKYYIIGYSDPQKSGWTVWERIVLYNSIYAVDHRMIPVVDMQNYTSIYQENADFGKKNIWEEFYEQPGGTSLEEAINSGDYVRSDDSLEWFKYIRIRFPSRIKNINYLRKSYNKYIRLKKDTIDECERRLQRVVPNPNKKRYLALCLRGTDYKEFHHFVQPEVETITDLAKDILIKYNCDYYFIATEDSEIYESIKNILPKDKIFTYNAGNVDSSSKGFVGVVIRNGKTAHEAAIDYLTTLYIMNKSVCLIGGLCGATIVAEYRGSAPYEYLKIIDMKSSY